MFVDRVNLSLFSGNGGDGKIAWNRTKFLPKGGPSGGDGGAGGDLFIQASNHCNTLKNLLYSPIIKAEDGQCGGSNHCHGRNGLNAIVYVPCGTVVYHADDNRVLGDLIQDGDKILLCRGGRGGFGNDHFKTSKNRAPRCCTKGGKRQCIRVKLELKIIVDIALVGLANSGKSTLFSALTACFVKTGDYPLTTLYPNRGHVTGENAFRACLVDTPGLIRGSHLGKGLGINFLQHTERSKILLFVVDFSRGEEEFLQDLFLLQEEIKAYDRELLHKHCLLIANKTDFYQGNRKVMAMTSFLEKNIFFLSARHAHRGTLRPLIMRLQSILALQKKEPQKRSRIGSF